MESLTFRSRIDLWLLVVAFGVPVGVLAVVLWNVPPDPGARVVPAIIVLLAIAFIFWLFGNTRYRLTDESLFITSGPCNWTVPIAEIESITPTRDPLSSPALSLRRLAIRYGRGRAVMISPADEEGFLRALEARRARPAAPPPAGPAPGVPRP